MNQGRFQANMVAYLCESGCYEYEEKIMEASNLELIVILLTVLGFGSSLIHYTAFMKPKAKAVVQKDLKGND
jgi:hypothetical protein